MTDEDLAKAEAKALSLEDAAGFWGALASTSEARGLAGSEIARERERELLAMALYLRARIKLAGAEG